MVKYYKNIIQYSIFIVNTLCQNKIKSSPFGKKWQCIKQQWTGIGAGIKGLVCYQWRGDHPAVGVPFPNSCGLLNYDGTKTDNFDNAALAVARINELNDILMPLEGVHLSYFFEKRALLQIQDGNVLLHKQLYHKKQDKPRKRAFYENVYEC